jgi:kinesin family protein 5
MENNFENIVVVARIKPTQLDLIKDGNKLKYGTLTRKGIVYNEIGISLKDHNFTFDRVFGPDCTQTEVFEFVGQPIINAVCQGFNSTIFAYGATCSGKTYTMFGNKNNPGIVPRIFNNLFQKLEKTDVGEKVGIKVKCSFIEIYQEKLRDLFDFPSKKSEFLQIDYNNSLRIRHDFKNTYVRGAIEKEVTNTAGALALLAKGMAGRAVTSTATNTVSSRSHAVFIININQTLLEGSTITSKLFLVDLAGSENVERANVSGVSLEEAKNINKSLSCLGNVIHALTEQKVNFNHVPYRDSKLTYLLQNSFGGNSKTTLVVTVNVENDNTVQQSLNSLRFAKRAKEIKNTPKANREVSREELIKTIELLKTKINLLEADKSDRGNSGKEGHQTNTIHEDLLLQRCEVLESLWRLERERADELDQILEEQRNLTLSMAKKLFHKCGRLTLFKSENSKYLEILSNLEMGQDYLNSGTSSAEE